MVCFPAGTRILTNKGDQLIETLRVGDMIATRDNGLQPLRWIGSKQVTAIGKAAPICIKLGALNNTRDLLVSPNHRMLLDVGSSESFFPGEPALNALEDDTRAEVLSLFPELKDRKASEFASTAPCA